MKKVPSIPNWVNGQETQPDNNLWMDKFNPHTGELQCYVANSSVADAREIITAAGDACTAWSQLTPVKRGQILGEVVTLMKQRAQELADCIAIETGKLLLSNSIALN